MNHQLHIVKQLSINDKSIYYVTLYIELSYLLALITDKHKYIETTK